MAEQQIAVSPSERQAQQRSAAETPAAPAEAPPRSRRALLLVVLGVLVAAYVGWRVFFAAPGLPDNIVAVSGRIEGDDSAVAPNTSGRILEVRVREGDSVKAGDVIAVLDDAQVRAREDATRAAVTAAQATAKS